MFQDVFPFFSYYYHSMWNLNIKRQQMAKMNDRVLEERLGAGTSVSRFSQVRP